MLNLNLVKKVVVGALALYALRVSLRWRKILLEWQRKKVLLRRLPSPPVPKEAQKTLDFLGWIKRSLPEGEKLDSEAISKYFLTSVQKVHYEHGNDEGIMVHWIVNPSFTPLPIGNVIVWDMDLVRELTSAKLLPKMVKSKAYRALDDLIGKEGVGIALSNHADWHPQRIVFDRGFTNDYAHTRASMIRETVQQMTNKWKNIHQQKADGENVLLLDIVEDVKRAVFDVFGKYAFSYDVGSITNHDAKVYIDYEEALLIIQARMRNPFLYHTRNILPTAANRDFRKRVKDIEAFIGKMFNDRVNEKVKSSRNDLLDILLESYNGDGIPDPSSPGNKIKLTRFQIVENMKAFFLGGHESTAAALTWGFYLITKHPEVKKKLLEEFEENGNDMSPEKLENYRYLNAVVLEVLRMYPSLPFMKEATEDITIGNGRYLIPKGVELFFFPYFQHRDPKNFHKPNDFIPERWLDPRDSAENLSLQSETVKLSRSKAYFPFALGVRDCIGKKLVLLQMRIFILEVISTFEMELPPKMPEGFQEVPYLGATSGPRLVTIKLKPKE